VIVLLKAPPFATVQDFGFPTGRAWGLPRGGAMDPVLLALANELVGNPPDAAAIEWALGPGALRAEHPTRIAVLGPAAISVNDIPLDPPELVFPVAAGATVSLDPGPQRRYSYLAVAGGFEVPAVLGSRSTYLPGGIGGHEGRRLRDGDRLLVGAAQRAGGHFQVVVPELVEPAEFEEVVIRVIRGTQWSRFDESERRTLLEQPYSVDPASDRLGYRLLGPPIRPSETATLPSEAACPGAIQIPDGGQPIVLMPDGPTVGGYAKLAVVIHADLRKLAQCRPGRVIRFREVSLETARACYSEGR
jgi:biotin-dependent carboxylase-like uncharacterized protein